MTSSRSETTTSHERKPAANPLQAWRRSERDRLIELRMASSPADRAEWSERISGYLFEEITARNAKMVSAYWPIRGEPELRPLLKRLAQEGIGTALPVVIQKNHPMEFRQWKSGDRLERGIWKIPFPADGRVVEPDVVISPVVGYDDEGYRLGYGGGFFDRTLAGFGAKPHVLGIGYAFTHIPTIRPQPFDIPMTRIITEEGVMIG